MNTSYSDIMVLQMVRTQSYSLVTFPYFEMLLRLEIIFWSFRSLANCLREINLRFLSLLVTTISSMLLWQFSFLWLRRTKLHQIGLTYVSSSRAVVTLMNCLFPLWVLQSL